MSAIVEMSVPVAAEFAAAVAAAEMSVPTANVVTWTTKSGRSVTRNSPIGAISAPKSVQVGCAIDATIAQWKNGQFRPFLKDVRDCLSDKQALAIANLMGLHPANKVDSEGFLNEALKALTHKTVKNIVTEVTPKGEKARIVATIQAILE